MFARFDYSVLLFAFILSSGSLAALYKGDKCSLKDGNPGICKLIKECPTAVELIKTGIHPVQCGFEKTEPIVCCEDGEETTSSTSTTTTTKISTSTTTTTNPVTSRTTGDKSRQKCEEYADYAYEKIPSPTLLLYPHYTKKLVCGIRRATLIVGSIFAEKREFPHMALIGFKSNEDDEASWLCGGSLISENFVLTTAHCTNSRDFGPPKVVRFGLTNKTDLTHMQERTVNEAIPHPKYRGTKYHDIGLLRLSENVKCNTYVRPACLYTFRYTPYHLAIATGWGPADYREEPSDELWEIVTEFFGVDKCNASYKQLISDSKTLKDGIVEDLMICTGTSKPVRTPCQGDTGGPLQVYHSESERVKCMYDIIGVIAFGKSCGFQKDMPTVHTRVSTYIKWIEDTVWPN